MGDLEASVDALAEDGAFAGVVRVDRRGRTELAKAYGDAHRALGVPNTLYTQFGIASGTKALTALTIVSLIEDGVLELATTARSVLGEHLPLVGDGVSVESLLAHRSGIGDYLEEGDGLDLTEYLIAVPVHRLDTTEAYLSVLEGHPEHAGVDEVFSYCNGGYVILALIAERAARVPFPDLVADRVCRPAGMGNTSFVRSDELPGRAALGYLAVDSPRTNVLHLPVRGSGDGGIYTTVGDVHALWEAFMGGRVVAPAWVLEMTRPRSDAPAEEMRYGLGMWLHASSDAVIMEGSDAGVSFRSVHDPAAGTTHTVISNTTAGAWPIARHLDEVGSS